MAKVIFLKPGQKSQKKSYIPASKKFIKLFIISAAMNLLLIGFLLSKYI